MPVRRLGRRHQRTLEHLPRVCGEHAREAAAHEVALVVHEIRHRLLPQLRLLVARHPREPAHLGERRADPAGRVQDGV
eukprot:5920698-Prymnesium_polylepis.1